MADHDAAPGEGGELAVGGAHHHVVVVLQAAKKNTRIGKQNKDDLLIKFKPEDEKAGADDHAQPGHRQSKGRPGF